MANLKYSDKHNMVAFLKKPNESVCFTEVVDFLKGTSLKYALTHNPTIYDSLVKQFWQTATVRTLANGTQQLIASIDSKEYTITESSVRSNLQLADATGIHNLSDAKIYARLATLGYVTEGDFIPLLPAMLAGEAVDQGKGSAKPAKPHHTPVDPILSTSQPPLPSPPHPSPPHPSPPLPSPPHPLPPHQSPPFSPPHYSPSRSYEAPLPKGNTSRSAEDSMQLKELMVLVPTLVTKINSLEKELKDTKQTLGNAALAVVLKLVKKVKSLETALKRKSKKVIMSESESEEPEDQGRIIQDIDDDPLVSLVLIRVGEQGKNHLIRARDIDSNRVFKILILVVSKVDSGTASKRGQREGKALMVEEDIQATKAKLKRYGEELQTKIFKETKVGNAKYEQPGQRMLMTECFWSYSGTMFDPPLNEDAIWSLPFNNNIANGTGKEISNPVDSYLSKATNPLQAKGLDPLSKKDPTDTQKNLYNALVKSYNTDKDIITLYGDVVTLKRGRDDQDKDEDPSTGSNQGASKSQPKSLGKSAHTEEHDQKAADLEDQPQQEFNTGNEDESPVREAQNEDVWHRNPSRPPTPDREWHKTKTVEK
ncbi:hypothetical protein Tco_1091862 [Tanacetum coccineum]|uniref:Xylulose kinase-1 n=1 Tax=Tanacetum coccineum TaxID=301880 RepID=A0ABQ5I9E5_9ASTR